MFDDLLPTQSSSSLSTKQYQGNLILNLHLTLHKNSLSAASLNEALSLAGCSRKHKPCEPSYVKWSHGSSKRTDRPKWLMKGEKRWSNRRRLCRTTRAPCWCRFIQVHQPGMNKRKCVFRAETEDRWRCGFQDTNV
jgi:hypothetical protein